ncbi:MAG: phosphate ABC transporter permease PstA [Candidatus Brocadiaceae bacterium]|nr:phosphate ABC transporter permease PstA [Candidatus Brocadiaceae bacterium]
MRNKLFISVCCFAAILCTLILSLLLFVIALNGAKAVNLRFLLSDSRNFGAEGGIVYQIMGSILLISGAAFISLPIALGTALCKSEYIKNTVLQQISSMMIYGLNGVPSVIFGIFGLLFFVNFLNTGISWFVGSIILAVMIIPTIVLAAYQSMSSIPAIYRESAYALGMDKWKVIAKVILPQGIHGAVTGLFIGLARAIGETAPVMFIATAFSGAKLPDSLFQPVTALPTHILALAQQATNSQALLNAWGTSLVLMLLVFSLSLSALFTRVTLQSTGRR